MNLAMISAFALYFGILFSIAFSFYRRATSSGAFMLGNRGVNYLVTAISAQASDMGAWLFIGYPAFVYAYGLSQIWTALGLLVFMALNWVIVAPRLRRLTAQYNSYTLWSFFTSRFEDPTPRLRLVGTAFSILFFAIYVATGLIGISDVLVVDFGFAYGTALIVSSILASSYILIGGFLAVAWCNLFKGLFLLVSIVTVAVMAYFTCGGAAAIIPAAQAHGVSLNIFGSWTNMFSLFFGWGLGYFGQQHILVNFMSIDDPENLKKSRVVGLIWQVIVMTASIVIGLSALAFFAEPINAEHIYLLMLKSLFGPFLVGLISCGMLASIVSTATLQVLVAASALSQDIYKVFFNREATSQQITRVTRLATIALAAVSTIIAYFTGAGIYKLVFFSWSGLGCAFGPLVLLSLYSTYINRHGALAAMISGGLAGCLLPLVTTIPALIPGVLISTACAYAVSYLTR